MNGSDMRSKAAAMFGKSFMAETKPKPLAKNAAVASNKVSKDRPIPAFKVGGPVKRMPFDVKPEDEGVTGSGNTPLGKTRKETVAKTATENAKNAGKPVKKAEGGTPKKPRDEVSAKEYYGIRSQADEAGAKAFAYNRGEKFDPKKHGDWYTQKEFIGAPASETKKNYKYTSERIKASEADTAKRSAEGRKRLVEKYKADEKPVKKVEGGRIGSRIIPIAMRNPDTMGAGSGIGDMRASFGGVGGSMRPDYSGSQGRMMQDLDRESRMTGEAGTPRGVGLRVGTRFKKGGKVQTSADTAKKLATEMGGMKCGGKAGKYAVGGAGKMRKGQCDTPTKLAKGGAGKVRKGMMSQTGQIMQAVKPGKGIGGK